MKKWIVLVFLAAAFTSAPAQYSLHKEVDGVQFYTKWSHEKWWSKKSPRVLLVKVVNTTDTAATWSLGVEFFKDLKLVEQARVETYCLKPHATAKPRVKGLVFKPAAGPSEYDSFELTGLDIEKTGSCEVQ